jgi:hypothetical protein
MRKPFVLVGQMGHFECNSLIFIGLGRKWQGGGVRFPVSLWFVWVTAKILRAGLGASTRLLAVEG